MYSDEIIEAIYNLYINDKYTTKEISTLINLEEICVKNILDKKLKNITIYKEPIIYCNSIIKCSLVDGEGLRNVLFCNFCNHKCLGCHNPETHNLLNGKPKTITELFNELTSTPLGDITFSGGDPVYQNKAFTILAKKIKKETNKNIWLYTGYTWEELIKDKNNLKLLKYIDVVVDGKFDINKRDISLKFIGSKNQRIIDVNKSIKNSNIIIWKGRG